MSKIIILITSFLIAFVVGAADRLYRWKNESGKYVISDTIPSHIAKRGYEIINSEGRVISRVGKAKTKQDLKREELIKKKKVAIERQREKDKRRDKRLLSLYSSQEDIINRRNKQLSTINQLIKIQLENNKTNKIFLEKYKKNIEKLQLQNKKIPLKLKNQYNEVKDNLINGEKIIEDKRKDYKRVEKQYNADLARFKVLKSRRARN